MLDAGPEVVAHGSPNLAVDLQVHLLVQLLRQLERNRLNALLRKHVLVQLLISLSVFLELGFLCPMHHALNSEVFVCAVMLFRNQLNDLLSFIFDIVDELSFDLFFHRRRQLAPILQLDHLVVAANVNAGVLEGQQLNKAAHMIDAKLLCYLGGLDGWPGLGL